MSAPTLSSNCFDNELLRQQHSSILTTTTKVHVDCGVRYEAKESNRDLPKDGQIKLQGAVHVVRNLSRSNSWDASVTVLFSNRKSWLVPRLAT